MTNNIDKNKRRIPTGEGVMEDKKFNDLVYAYLQSISYRDPEKEDRFLFSNQLNYTKIAKELRMNLKTLKSKIKYLFDMGYIVEKKGTSSTIYRLPNLKDYYFLIPNETLKYLVDTSNENVIMVYSYLGQLKNGMKDRAYFTKSKLLILLGYKTKTRQKDEYGNPIYRASTHSRDWERINNILNLLEKKLKLITTTEQKEYIDGNTISKFYFDITTEIEEN